MDMSKIGSFVVNITSLEIFTSGSSSKFSVRVYPNQIIKDGKYLVEYRCIPEYLENADCEFDNGFNANIVTDVLHKYLNKCFTAYMERSVDAGSMFFYTKKVAIPGTLYTLCAVMDKDDNSDNFDAVFIPAKLVPELYDKAMGHGKDAWAEVMKKYKERINYGKYVVSGRLGV